MKRLMVLGAALLMAGLIGCNASEPGGKKDDNTKTSATFKLKGPLTSTTIKQGDKQTVKLTVDRGKDFKKDVTLKADAPKGLTVDLEPKVVKASDSETVNMAITAEKDAPVGEHTIKLTATPSEGNPVDLDVKVKVEKKDS